MSTCLVSGCDGAAISTHRLFCPKHWKRLPLGVRIDVDNAATSGRWKEHAEFTDFASQILFAQKERRFLLETLENSTASREAWSETADEIPHLFPRTELGAASLCGRKKLGKGFVSRSPDVVCFACRHRAEIDDRRRRG